MDALRVAALLVTLALAPAHHNAATRPTAGAAATAPIAFRGTGSWIDRYDLPKLADPQAVVDDMAAHGVQTLYVETASWKVSRSIDVLTPETTAALIEAAHARGIRVVAWYLPGLRDLRTDMRRVRAALALRTPLGQRFDAFALDIEANLVRPLAQRNAALLKLTRQTRRATGHRFPLGAIVPDQLSTTASYGLWPAFPYAAIARYYDAFLPMAYSTFGRAHGRRAVYRYTAANVRFVRAATGRPVHLIGGLTDNLSPSEQSAVGRASRDAGAVGVSLYKYELAPLRTFSAWRAQRASR